MSKHDPFAKPQDKETPTSAEVSAAQNGDDLEAQAIQELVRSKMDNKVPTAKAAKAYTNEELQGIKIEDIDWSKVSEEDILRLPLEAKAFSDVPMLAVKPKDSTVVFYFAYCGNLDAKDNRAGPTNIAKLKAKGYEFATLADVDGGEEKLIEGSVGADGLIRYYDVVLMKINKLRLYQHLKAKLIQAVGRTDPMKANKMAAEGAEAFMENTNSAALAAARQSGKHVSFYN